MSQHTEGPWFVSESPVLAVVAREGHPVICELTATDDRSDCGAEVLANAHMLASAPTLRRALEKAVSRFEHCAGMIDAGFNISGILRAEQAMKVRHFALEAREALSTATPQTGEPSNAS